MKKLSLLSLMAFVSLTPLISHAAQEQDKDLRLTIEYDNVQKGEGTMSLPNGSMILFERQRNDEEVYDIILYSAVTKGLSNHEVAVDPISADGTIGTVTMESGLTITLERPDMDSPWKSCIIPLPPLLVGPHEDQEDESKE